MNFFHFFKLIRGCVIKVLESRYFFYQGFLCNWIRMFKKTSWLLDLPYSGFVGWEVNWSTPISSPIRSLRDIWDDLYSPYCIRQSGTVLRIRIFLMQNRIHQHRAFLHYWFLLKIWILITEEGVTHQTLKTLIQVQNLFKCLAIDCAL